MTCHKCQVAGRKYGKDRKGHQRFICPKCGRTFTEPHQRPYGNMYLDEQRGLMTLQLLVEGNSIRSIERSIGVCLDRSLHRDTILKLVVLAGERCENLLNRRGRRVAVDDVQCDEIWGFCFKKEAHKNPWEKDDPKMGDAYCFVGIERGTKLVLAWHLGRRTTEDTLKFTEKLRIATTGHFQITTDGFQPYRDAIPYSLGMRTDFAQLIKVYATPREGEQRYSPPDVVEAVPKVIHGDPDRSRICTSHVERQNLTMRMQIRRLTRLTNAFSKKWETMKAALAFHFAHYNYCRVHQTLRVTPAMEAGLTDHVWSLAELLAA